MPKISLSGPAELLTVIPFHLGFQPARSVVVVCFHGRRLGLLARLDLVGAELAAEAAAHTVPTLLQDDPSSVALVAFEDEPDEGLPLLQALADAVEGDRVLVRERLLVRDGRWRSVGCDCCPDEGWLLPKQADVPAVADYVALGHAVLSDREELARLAAPLDSSHPLHDGVKSGVEDWQRRYAAAGGTVSDQPGAPASRAPRRSSRARAGASGRRLVVLDGGDPSDRQALVDESLAAWAAVLHGDVEETELADWVPSLVGPLRDVQVRDALVGWLCAGSVPLDQVPDGLLVLLEELLGPGLRVSPAGRDEEPVDGEWSGTDGVAPVTPSGALDDVRRADDLGRVDGLDVDELVVPGDFDDLEATAGLEELGEWEEAVVPRVLLARLEQVCRLTPRAHAAALLSVLASLAWWSGDGARAGVAVDLALEIEPEHRLSRLVRQSLDHGVRPRRCA